MVKKAIPQADRLAEAQDSLTDEYQQLLASSLNEERCRDLAESIKALQDCLAKIRGCKAAVMTNMFHPDKCGPSRNPDVEFASTTKWLFKIPKEDIVHSQKELWGISTVLGHKINKKDTKAIYKLVYRHTLWEPHTHSHCFVKADFFSTVRARMKYIKSQWPSMPSAVPCDVDGAIDWVEYSLYKLLPGMPDSGEPDQHKFGEA